MKKISVYVLEQTENAADNVLSAPYEKLAAWLWDHDLEVVNILCEDVEDEEAIKEI
ncbi:hypothetical protein QA584_12995 [Anaerocolumna sp. AGMB13025]|jgi:hypothetical protein|uniref:hypothetical protein n=1 Tax=Anaerocolumna sp. AGMB13025 TaxID=3039116 RepID=UPI00241C192B|nr:hypothetical protein [Anaerocolumna sp. AGMB13025]WFR59956.1 hypothetical protein QA584_12995 [Anaerocolumna sp. AGMB13025]